MWYLWRRHKNEEKLWRVFHKHKDRVEEVRVDTVFDIVAVRLVYYFYNPGASFSKSYLRKTVYT